MMPRSVSEGDFSEEFVEVVLIKLGQREVRRGITTSLRPLTVRDQLPQPSHELFRQPPNRLPPVTALAVAPRHHQPPSRHSPVDLQLVTALLLHTLGRSAAL